MSSRLIKLVFCLMLINGSADVSAMSGRRSAGGAVHPIITDKSGHVTIKGSQMGVWEPVVEDTLVLSSDFIRTAQNSWARVEFKRGSIELYGSSLLYVPSIKGVNGEMDISDVALLKGVARFDIVSLNKDRPFEFRTENTIGVVKGTLFVVTADADRTGVAVYKGKVSLRNADRNKSGELSLSRGHVATILADGSVEGFGVFNANEGIMLLAEGVEPDIYDDRLNINEADRDNDGNDRDVGDRVRDDSSDGDTDEDKNRDEGDGDRDKNDGDDKNVMGNIDRFKHR